MKLAVIDRCDESIAFGYSEGLTKRRWNEDAAIRPEPQLGRRQLELTGVCRLLGVTSLVLDKNVPDKLVAGAEEVSDGLALIAGLGKCAHFFGFRDQPFGQSPHLLLLRWHDASERRLSLYMSINMIYVNRTIIAYAPL